MLILMALFVGGALLGFTIATWKSSLILKNSQMEKALLEEKIEFFQKSGQFSVEQFRGVSIEALRHNHELFLQLAEASFEKFHQKTTQEVEKKEEVVRTLLAPVREALSKFDGKIEELEKSRIGAYSGLKEHMATLVETQKELRKETATLGRALRSPIIRGRWGEIQLRRVVELAGMLEHCDFFEQTSVTVEEKKFRPDLLIKLPGQKQIVIDAKAPLEAYLEAIECPEGELRDEKMKAHARQVRQHVTMLGRKSYWEQFQPTPEFVILFLPAESFFYAALEHDAALIEAGVDQQVILATPITLIALLRTIAYGWRQERVSQNAEEITLFGRELYKRVSDMSQHFAKVGRSLGSAVEAYNKTVGSLESRVLVSARRLKEREVMGGLKEIEPLEPVPQITRELQIEELMDENSAS